MPTINDIAKELKISNATVSRALRGSGYVNAELKEKIISVAKELNYTPNPLAVGLRTRKSNVISIIVPSINNPVSTSLLRYIEKLASGCDFNVIICATDENIEIEYKHMQLMDAGLIDGVILVPCIRQNPEDEYLKTIKKQNIILFNRILPDIDLDVVKSDQFKASYLAVEHCCKIGYRRLGVISSNTRNSLVLERYNGYLAAAKDYGLGIEESLIKRAPVSAENGRKLTHELLSMPEPPECILIMDNIFTIGTIQAIKEAKVRVPEDIAYISYDDIINGELIDPRVTYIGQPMHEIAEQIFEKLMYKIENHPSGVSGGKQIINMPVQLVVRDSCGYQKRDS